MGIFAEGTINGGTAPTLPKQRLVVPQIPHDNPTDFNLSDSFRLYKPTLREAKQAEVQVYESGVYWEFPDVPFRSIYDYYKKDPGIQSAVNAYVNEIIGPGFYVTADNKQAQELVEKWHIDNDFERKLKVCLTDTLMLGCSLTEVVEGGTTFDIVPVDMRSIVAVQRDKYGKVEFYVQQTLQQTYRHLPADKFIKFSHIEVGRMAWPIGIFHSLVVPFFDFENEPWSLADVDALMRQDYARIIHKMAAPRVWHIYENASEEKLKAQAGRDKLMKAGERGYVNSPFEIMQEGLDSTARFTEYIEFLTNAKENGLQAPTAKIMTATGISNATYASAEAGHDMFAKSLEGIKRQWEQQIEQKIYKPLLARNGIDIAEAELEFHWGVPDQPDVDLNSMLALFTSGAITIEEFREYLRNVGLPLSHKKMKQKKDDGEDEELKSMKKEAYRKLIRKLDEK